VRSGEAGRSGQSQAFPSDRRFSRPRGDLGELIAAQCRFKASIVARDEREQITRTDRRSRRILNLGTLRRTRWKK